MKILRNINPGLRICYGTNIHKVLFIFSIFDSLQLAFTLPLNPIMKRLLILLLLLTPVLSFSQGNSMFYPLVKDASYTLVSINKKGKQTSTETHKIVSVEALTNGTKATVECSSFDVKNKPIAVFTYQVEINNETTKIDWRARLNGIQNAVPVPLMQDGTPCYFELPNNPQVGQTLNDCLVSFEKGKALYEAKFYEIKITGKETITVGGTSYEAYVLEYGFQTRLKEGLDIKFDKYHKDWYVPGKGLVKAASAGSSRNPKPTDELAFFTELK